MAKAIVFCADGTWNGPAQDQNDDGQADNTNVFKLFCSLEGQLSLETVNLANEQEKILLADGAISQVSKYIHGVGDSRNPINKLLGGAFGAGIIGRIVRGYTFISRNYEPGDRIVLVGFSRGAYTARALAGLIAAKGLLAKRLTANRTAAYRAGANAWYLYRGANKSAGFLARLVEAVSDLPAFLSRHMLSDADFVPVPTILAVGVWDTVGSLGLPNYIKDPGVDSFRFTDTRLSPKVAHGFHAVSRDERREDFIPTLWDPAANVTQLLFAGAHGDVGGGYPMLDRESGLSDIALSWMVSMLRDVDVRFAGSTFVPPFAPDPLGTAHKPWAEFPFNLPDRIAERRFAHSLAEHPSVVERRGQLVVQQPGEEPTLYQ